ncbi:MAG: APC family permease [Candidatus Diapherotrites archaeon]|nr:APC family permease [Candidatus Diapherotrites archaeon]
MPLKKEFSLLELTLCGMGIILGAGIYALIGQGAAVAGNAVWLSFAFGALIAATTGFSYAELSSMYPEAGAEYDYSRHAFGKKIAFFTGWLVMFASILGATTVAIGFGGYFGAFFSIQPVYGAIAIIVASTVILLFGVSMSAKLGAIITLIEASGLLFIIFVGLPHIGSFDFTSVPSIQGVLSGAVIVFFAFLGFEEMARFSEETADAKNVMPKALMLAIAGSTILYILVAIASVSIVGAPALAQSGSPLATVAQATSGPQAFYVLSVIALFSTSNTVLLVLLAASRFLYGISKEHALPPALHVVSGNGVPWVAVIVTGFLALAFLAIGAIDFVASAVDLSLFFVFLIINCALIKLRLSHPQAERPFKSPFSVFGIPIMALAGIAFTSILIFSIRDPKIFEVGLAVATTGIIAAFLFVKGPEAPAHQTI